ncbi:MAG: hypothetical protein A2219_02685 [Elusimicrobia bacterium RIFOXYA2_FULL_50_26]|nr:MAG: hypothetical protein A2219_02685 [Elusimicrobia bacterium RIFOXYA2_FULL_50_26]
MPEYALWSLFISLIISATALSRAGMGLYRFLPAGNSTKWVVANQEYTPEMQDSNSNTRRPMGKRLPNIIPNRPFWHYARIISMRNAYNLLPLRHRDPVHHSNERCGTRMSLQLHILWIIGLALYFMLPVLSGLCAADPGLTVKGEHISIMEKTMTEKSIDNPWFIGRFHFVLPSTLVLSGRSQSIYRVTIKTVPIPPSGPQIIWADRLTQIRSLGLPPDETDAVVRSFELQPGMPAVWYRNSRQFAQLRMLEAMKPEVDHVLLMARATDAGKEYLVETLLKNVVNAYETGHARGFCVEHGSIAGEPGENEQARASFDHPSLPSFEITFYTHTVREPSRMNPLSEIDDLQAQSAREGVQLKVLKDEPRSAAGLSGRENITSLAEPGAAPFVRFTWHFPGVPLRSDQPEILLEASARLVDQAELRAVWEALLGSLRQVPMK